MRNLTLIAIFVCSPIVLHAQTFDRDAVLSGCSKEWGTEYDMVVYCLKQHEEGFQEYLQTRAVHPKLLSTFDACQRSWGIEWSMVAYCAKQEAEAFSALDNIVAPVPDDVGLEILTSCVQEWEEKWSMVAYCAKERVTGWRNLFE